MNNIKSYSDFITEMKSDKDIVKDLARHLAFDKDVIKYLNTSRAKREMGWRELLDLKLHGNNKNYINYLTKNMIADYNPQITGYIKIDDEGDFDQDVADRNQRFNDMDLDDKLDDLNIRTSGIEQVLGINPDNEEESIEKVDKALQDAGYEKPEVKSKEDEEEEKEEPEEEKEEE